MNRGTQVLVLLGVLGALAGALWATASPPERALVQHPGTTDPGAARKRRLIGEVAAREGKPVPVDANALKAPTRPARTEDPSVTP